MAITGTLTTPATGAVAMRSWKTALVAAGFTVPSSSDGLTYNASGDQITTDSGAGSFDNTDAWCRVRMPGGSVGAYREWLVQRKADNQTWTVYYTKIGFVGGSPNATTAPSATDGQTLRNNATLFATDGTYRLLVCVDSTTPYYNGMLTFPTGGGVPLSSMLMVPMRSGSYPSGDTDPYSVLVDYTGGGILTGARLTEVNTGTPKAWSNPAASGGGSAAFSYCQWTQPFATCVGVLSNTLGLTSVGSYEMPAEVLAVMIDAGPVYRGAKGYLNDVRACMSPTGTTPNGAHMQTTSDSRYWFRAGHLWLPWGATPPAL